MIIARLLKTIDLFVSKQKVLETRLCWDKRSTLRQKAALSNGCGNRRMKLSELNFERELLLKYNQNLIEWVLYFYFFALFVFNLKINCYKFILSNYSKLLAYSKLLDYSSTHSHPKFWKSITRTRNEYSLPMYGSHFQNACKTWNWQNSCLDLGPFLLSAFLSAVQSSVMKLLILWSSGHWSFLNTKIVSKSKNYSYHPEQFTKLILLFRIAYRICNRKASCYEGSGKNKKPEFRFIETTTWISANNFWGSWVVIDISFA